MTSWRSPGRRRTGLRAAHAGGILHRDVKPANLLARRTPGGWQVKVIDFGIAMRHGTDARSTARAAATGPLAAGTQAYAAPEQLAGAAVGPTADVYAFARTACRMLFDTTHPLPRHWKGVPAPLGELLGECLEDRPAARPGGFDEVLARLAAPVVPPPVPKLGPVLFPPPAPSSGPVDVERATSMLELVRLARRLLKLNPFQVAAMNGFPLVARSEAGGFEPLRGSGAGIEKVHPLRELARLREGQDDERLKRQIADLGREARARAKNPPTALLMLAGPWLLAVVLCPLFGLILTCGVKAGWQPSRSNPALFVLFTALTGLCGAATIPLGVLSIIARVQWGRMRRFAVEAVQVADPRTPVQPWPEPVASKQITWLLVGVGIIVPCLVAAVIAVAMW